MTESPVVIMPVVPPKLVVDRIEVSPIKVESGGFFSNDLVTFRVSIIMKDGSIYNRSVVESITAGSLLTINVCPPTIV